MNPIDAKNRIEILDYLRGFALLGIILVNILPLVLIKTPVPHTPSAAYEKFLYLCVEGRFYTIFSFLFGVGFYLFLSRADEKGKNGTGLFLRRLLSLFIFGIIHVQFHPGEALTVYAICGVIIFPFYKVPKKLNLIIGISILILFSTFSMKIFMTIPLMLLGISAGQYHIFEDIGDKTKQVAVFTLIMLIGSVMGLCYQFEYMPSVLRGNQSLEAQRFLDIGITIGPIISAFYSGILILALSCPVVKKILVPMKNYGRMALTNYIFQTIFIIIIGSNFSHLSFIQTLYLCIAVYVIQLIFSTIWLHYFRFGPLEWIWRAATYWAIPPLKIEKN